MSAEIKSRLDNKRLLILGFGKEGQSSYQLIRSYFPKAEVAIADRNENILTDHPGLSEDHALTVYAGKDYLLACSDYDLVIKSPGIPYDLVREKCSEDMITSQTDLFLCAFADRVIGITGTKGKSTTSTLVYHLLNHSGRNVVLSGNIGVPPLSLVQDIDPDTLVVFELSSHQLEHISVAPHIAVLLNIFPEHLDHYKDFTAYKMAKFNISLMQADGGILIYNADDHIIRELLIENNNNTKTLGFSASRQDDVQAATEADNIVLRVGSEKMHIPLDVASDLPGVHNRMNLMAALLACVESGMSRDEIIAGLASYKRPEHRLEYAGTYRGIKFYNDSIATVPEACVEALRTLERVDLLILGGHDRGLDYTVLYKRLNVHKVSNIIFMGNAGARMYKELRDDLEGISECHMVDGMPGAFDIILQKLESGDVCLLSPAAASYGMFRNFEERGSLYKKMAADIDRLPS